MILDWTPQKNAVPLEYSTWFWFMVDCWINFLNPEVRREKTCIGKSNDYDGGNAHNGDLGSQKEELDDDWTLILILVLNNWITLL